MIGKGTKIFAALAAVMIAAASCGEKKTESENVTDVAVTDDVTVKYPLGFCTDSLSVTDGKVKNGQFFSSLLGSLGLSAQEAYNLTQACDSVFDVRTLRVGQAYRAYYSDRILKLYGEVDNSRRLAQMICKAREISRIETTTDLGKAIESALPKFAEHKFLAKVYQALRIEVNQEMKSLEKFLSGAAKSLKPGGRLVVITYHSLEDRMVKNFIKAGNIEGKVEKDFYGNSKAPLRAVNRKPILPQESEIASNTRARSAKLRIAEKEE